MIFNRRLHGNEELNDPELAGKLCPKCNQRRDWVIVKRTEKIIIKQCKVCKYEMTVTNRIKVITKKDPPTPEKKEETPNIISSVLGLFKK